MTSPKLFWILRGASINVCNSMSHIVTRNQDTEYISGEGQMTHPAFAGYGSLFFEATCVEGALKADIQECLLLL